MVRQFKLRINQLQQTRWSGASILFFILLYRLLLDFNFIFFLEPYFTHTLFSVNFLPTTYLLSILMLVVNFSLMQSSDRLDSNTWFFFFMLVYVPLSSYFGMTDSNILWFLAVSSIWVIGTVLINSPIWNFELSKPLIPVGYFQAAILTFSALIIGIILSRIELNFSMGLTDVYELRAQKPTAFIPYSDYLINFLTKAGLPIVLLFALHRWNYINALVALVAAGMIVLFFFATGHKALLFNIPFLILLYGLVRVKNFQLNIVLFLLALLFTCTLLFFVFDQIMPLSLFYRRTLMIPAQLSFYYFDFFQDNALYLSNSIFSDFSRYPYEMQPPNVIADYYFHKPEMAASNGLISDGFRHFGVLGVVIWTGIFILILKIFHGFQQHLPKAVVGVLALFFAKTMIDGPLLTSLLTHGFLFVLVCLFFLKFSPTK
jgi:hypothetical protein